MICDLRSAAETELVADICVIGAGAAGIALAREFLHTSYSVILLDTGGLTFDQEAHSLGAGESVGVPFSGLQLGRYRGFGGTTRTWGGQCVMMDDTDFAARTWVPDSGWPIGLAEMEPYYRRAEVVLNVQGQAYDEKIWRRFRLTVPEFDRAEIVPRFTVYSPHPDFGSVYLRALREAPNVNICLYAHALRLQSSEGRRLTSGLVVGVVGATKVCRVRARVYVICCGGIESARLLLLSDQPHSDGLGNEHGNVGRYYQDHPNGYVGTVETRDARFLQDRFGLLYRGRVRYFPKLRLAAAKQRHDGVLNAVAHLVFEYDDKASLALRAFAHAVRHRRMPERFVQRLRDIIMGAPHSAEILIRRYGLGRSPALVPRRIHLQAHTEQAPNRDSRISLGDARDAFGQRCVRVDWRLGDLERRTFDTVAKTTAAEFSRLRLGTVRLKQWMDGSTAAWMANVSDAYHHIGATRMSHHPKDGVVDPNLRVHSLDNLYICSSSVFPTSGYANPTLTIVALALRLADTLKSRLTMMEQPGATGTGSTAG